MNVLFSARTCSVCPSRTPDAGALARRTWHVAGRAVGSAPTHKECVYVFTLESRSHSQLICLSSAGYPSGDREACNSQKDNLLKLSRASIDKAGAL